MRYYLRLTTTYQADRAVTEMDWLNFRTRASAEEFANNHQRIFLDERLPGAAQQTRWRVVDRGPWWRRVLVWWGLIEKMRDKPDET